MPLVLITGSDGRSAELKRSLAAPGWRFVTANGIPALTSLLDQIRDQVVDVYVQLPVEPVDAASTSVGRLRDLLSEGLLARCSSVELVIDAVADGGVVVLVAGNRLESARAHDDKDARYAMLNVLGRALAADCVDRGVGVFVLPSGTPGEDVARVLQGQPIASGSEIHQVTPSQVDFDDDWFLWFDRDTRESPRDVHSP